jgi:hypothetical protein
MHLIKLSYSVCVWARARVRGCVGGGGGVCLTLHMESRTVHADMIKRNRVYESVLEKLRISRHRVLKVFAITDKQSVMSSSNFSR